jgi:hypothetical protein
MTLNPARSSGDQLWISRPDGQRPRRLRIGTACAFGSAAFLPVARAVVFEDSLCSAEPPVYGLMRVNLDGSGLRRLSIIGPSESQPLGTGALRLLPGDISVSPDGRTVAYAFTQTRRLAPGRISSSSAVWFIDARTGHLRGSFTIPGDELAVAWLTSDRLLFLTPSGALLTSDLRGTQRHTLPLLLPPQVIVTSAAVSPSRTTIALTGVTQTTSCGRDTQPVCPSDIYLVPSGGGRARRLTFTGTSQWPVWSPDARQIAYQSEFGELKQVITISSRRIATLRERIPAGGLEIVDWQTIPG